MPTNSIDWSKTLIYKIISKDLNCNFIYIGSTRDFSRRLREHKSSCNNEKSEKYNYVLYKFIRENGEFDNFNMVLVEKYTECKDRLEARQREQYWIDELQPQLNEQRAFYAISKNEYDKRYRDEHKEEYNIWRENNKEYLKEYSKIYTETHKEDKKLYKQQRTKIEYICECGWIGNMCTKSNHITISKKHKDYLDSLVGVNISLVNVIS